MFKRPGRPWVNFWTLAVAGLFAVWCVTKIAGSSSHWSEVAFGVLVLLMGSVVIADWHAVSSYLMDRWPTSPPRWAGWISHEVTPEARRRTIRGWAWAAIAFGSFLVIHGIAHQVLGR